MTTSLRHSLIFAVLIALVILTIAALTTPEKQITKTGIGEASLTLLSPAGSTVEVGQLQNISWTSFNYGAKTVSVNIIRKISENPDRYELVRTVAAATRDDGDAVWVPTMTDAGYSTYVEVGCAISAQACRATLPTSALAVIDTGRFTNTAAAYESIERFRNR